jgi:hypothetical protein
MHPHALSFWQRIIRHDAISPEFKVIAADALGALRRIHEIAAE